jgi:hypothetical protein
MSAIDNAIADILYEIPIEILKAAFLGDRQLYSSTGTRQVYNTSLNDVIRNKVFDAKVLKDCDLLGGQEVIIPLYDTEYWKPDNYTTVFRVDQQKTRGLRITEILSVMYGYPDALYGSPAAGVGVYTGSVNQNSWNGAVTTMTTSMMQSYAPAVEIQLVNVEIVGFNTIAIYETQIVTQQLTLRCRLSNDAELNNIKNNSWPVFSELALLATKAYIYNTLRVKLDQGQLQGGIELGAFREIIMEYADSAQNYRDFFRERWQRVAAYNNTLGRYRAIRRATPKR